MKEKITIDRMREGVLDVISSDEEQYHEFLAYCSRGNLNRFSFGSQLVLYWQKPQASVVAGLHIWNQTGNRILRGKHGAHIYPEPHMMYRGKPELVVFDIQDTERSRNVELWEIKNGDHEAIALELTGGTEHSLLKAIQDMAVSHLRDIIRNDSSEKFEAYTGLYQDFICDSITEELALRSGLMGETGFRGNFSKVFQIDKQERMAFMKAAGEYTASIAKAVAVQIRSAVKRHTEKERGKGNGGQQREQDRNAGRYPDHLKKQDNELRIDETGLSRFDRGRDLSGDTEGRRGRDPHESIGEGRAESSRNRDADTQVVHGRTSEGSIGGIHEVSPVELPGRGDRKGNSDTRSGGNTAEPFPVREPQEKTEVLPVQEAFAEDFYYDLYGEDEYSARSGSKTRYRDNVTAIRLLKQLEKENRAALPKEQLLLSRYAGWGGIPQVFDENNSSWKKEYQELREVLTDSEYQAARASTLSAFYTDPELSGAIWQKLLDMGFEGGNVLEPSMGIGNFYSSMPEELRGQVKKYGVELDSISGRIAKKLHPSAHIEICGYEESDFGDNQFDVVIGNVPFGDFKVYDPKHRKENFSIHNYFFAKALDSVRAGGIVAFLTSTGTLDAVDDKARQYIAERAELLGAVRLPTRVFRDTETACDAVFLQKRESRSYQKADWTAAEPVLVSTQSGELLGHLENSPVLTMLSEWKCQIILESLMKQNGGDVLSLASDLYLERTDTGVAQRIIEDHFSKEYYRQLQASMLTDFMDYDYDRAVAYMQERCGRNPAYEGILTEMKKHPISGVTATMPNMQRILQFCGSSYDAKRFLGDIAESKYGRLRRNLHKELFMRLTGEDGRKTPEMTAYFEDKDEMTVNRYFNDHPEQILGKMVYQEGRFGGDSRYATCVNDAEEFDVRQEFLQAASGINGIYMSAILPDDRNVSEGILPAPADQKNFTFCVVNGNVYYKQDSVLIPCNKKTEKELDRIRSLLLVKKAVKNTLAVQLENCTDEVYEESRKILNQRYDEFFDMEKRRILDSVMEKAMHDDVEFPLLCALEQRMDDGTIQKADIFFRRTIHARENLIHAEDPMDALNISINRLNRVDLVYMGHLLDEMPYKDITEKLEGMIFLNPAHYLAEDYTAGWETAEEYLSGNVRDKLRVAELYAEKYPELFHGNVEALKDAQPKWLDASQIEVRLGTPWIDTEDYRKFLIETVPMTDFVKSKVKVEHDTADNSFLISNAEDLRFSEAATTVYGTKRLHVAEIMERVLNMRDIEVKDKVYDPVKEKDVYQVNAEETALAQAKAEQLKKLFKEWFWEDAERREKYVAYYNNTFNNTRLRRYDGSMLTFEGMNNEMALTSYQKDAVARILRGRNTLLSHCVGAGKTFEMQCGCMEMKRLGMISKALMVVPNHLTAQTASEFMKLYPSANILLTRKRDFEKKNRRIFISKIATGDYDCVIMGASQFEKISMSPEYEKTMLEKQIEETKEMLREIERTEEKSFSVKQIQKKLKQLEERSRRLINAPVRDDVIYFENLGIDCLIVDEAHDFKNLGIATKMTRVAGVPQQSSQKAFDLYMKKCYVEEHGGKIVFATGTPISNTMAEMYVMMKYLYEKEMNDMGIYCFDSWAACFGEIVPMLELKVAGDGYRTNNRFAKFSNVPELMSMFRSFTDVVLPDMINLPVPKLKNGTYTIVEAEPSQAVLEKMEEFVNRSEAIHNGTVNPQEDNMLKISGEARLLGTDIRLLDPYAPGYDGCKLDLAVDNICRKYQEFDVEKGTQIVFSDIGTPGSNRFNVYDYIREECIKRGIPEDEIAFIHNADTEKKKEELFAKMKAGTVRILIGSTSKMGTGMNVQDRVCAIHEIDIPWRPADVGQILRTFKIKKNVEVTDNGKINI